MQKSVPITPSHVIATIADKRYTGRSPCVHVFLRAHVLRMRQYAKIVRSNANEIDSTRK